MRAPTDNRLETYRDCAEALPTRTVALILAMVESKAAHDDDKAEASVEAIVMAAPRTVGGGEVPIGKAVRIALKRARAHRIADQAKCRPVDVTDPETLAGLEALTAGDGDRDRDVAGLLFGEAMATLPPADQAVLAALTADVTVRRNMPTLTVAGDRVDPEHRTGTAVEVRRTRTDDTAGRARHTGGSGRVGLRLPVVSEALAAVGVDLPVKGNSHTLREVAAVAYGRLSATLRPCPGHRSEAYGRTGVLPSEAQQVRALQDVPPASWGDTPLAAMVSRCVANGEALAAVRATASLRYLTRRRTFNGQAVWQQDARPKGVPASAYSTPEATPAGGALTANGGTDRDRGAASLPVPGVYAGREVTVTDPDGRDVTVWLPGTGHGQANRQTVVAVDHTAAEAARKADRAETRAEQHRDRDADQHRCQRPDVTGDTATCRCGARPAGTPLAAVTVSVPLSPYGSEARAMVARGEAVPDTVERVVWAHPLTPCPAPAATPNGLRCGCGRKRGALTADGEHRARTK